MLLGRELLCGGEGIGIVPNREQDKLVYREQQIAQAVAVGDAVLVSFVQQAKGVDHQHQKQRLRKDEHEVKRDKLQVAEVSVLHIA